MTLNDWLLGATLKLAQSGIVSARLDSELLAAAAFSESRIWLHAHLEQQITKTRYSQLTAWLKRRLDHEPLAYILGFKEFYGRDFAVTPDVLVPRPESEHFIELIKTLEEKDFKFIDIGTGSGILAITTALEQPTWTGVATDISPAALKVAQTNAGKLKVQNLVFKVQNLLVEDNEKYDLVIANLPYVPKNLRGKADIAHEPEIALFADRGGLALYWDMFAQIAKRTQKPDHIMTESLLEQHNVMKKIAIKSGYLLAEVKGLVQHFKLAA